MYWGLEVQNPHEVLDYGVYTRTHGGGTAFPATFLRKPDMIWREKLAAHPHLFSERLGSQDLLRNTWMAEPSAS